MTVTHRRPDRNPANRPTPAAHRWLLFVHQLPSSPSNLRVRTWRRLQQIGALPIRQALYVLPDSPNAREDFEWLRTEIEAAGGQATVFAADAVDAWSNDALTEEFRRSRQESYAVLAREAEQLLKRLSRRSRVALPRRAVQQLKERFAAVERVDFFGSAGRDGLVALVRQLEQHGRPGRGRTPSAAAGAVLEDYQARVWITRPRPGVDRMASAWLIRRFIDPQARFGFAADRESMPSHAIPFDMFGVEFSHQGEGCTFETLCAVFGIHEAAVARVAAIVHDLDLKDGRFGAPETATVGTVIDGLQLAVPEDDALLADGMTLFESLYRAFERSTESAGPRPVARPRKRDAARQHGTGARKRTR